MKLHRFPMYKMLKKISRISYMLGAALLIASLVLNLIPGSWQPVMAASVTPITVPGNPTCIDRGYEHGLSTEGPPPVGTSYWNDGKLFVTIILDADKIHFSWSSNIGVDAVIAKGGNGANIYVYDPPAESLGDSGLHAPNNPNGRPAEISHVAFCYDDLAATPTDEPTATPTDEPTATPTDEPTATPTDEPTATPTDEPTATPTDEPTVTPTDEPTVTPTDEPTATPTDEPTATPTDEPTATPTDEPTATPTDEPTATPTDEP
ncbi:MAG: hypothetical protein ACYC3H_08495, partial [Bellilinea sp.]